jgi:hypothetical protein
MTLYKRAGYLFATSPQKIPSTFSYVFCLGPFLILYPIPTYVFQAMWYNIFAKNFFNTEWNKELFFVP